MSNKINSGGPAFPVDVPGHKIEIGMTLRDYFAAKAMQALMHEENEMSYKYISKFSYAVADAMLRARGSK